MNIAIIVNGSMNDLDFYKKILNTCEYIICADGASNYAYKMGIIPDLIMGDLDSIDKDIKEFYENENVKFEKYPQRKNETDSEICVQYACDLNPQEIIIIGAIGSRVDHSLASIYLMYKILQKGIKSRIINETNEIYITSSSIDVYGTRGDLLSIIPCFGSCKGVTLKGLEYPLENFDLEAASSRGISNVMKSDKCSVNVEEGVLFVIKSKDA